MFKKLFGGSDKPKKEEQPQQPQQPQPIPNIQIEFEKLQYQIKQQEDNFEKKIDKYTERIDNLRNTAKELIKKGQKKHAASKLQEIQQLEQYITRAENQKQVFLKVRMQLEHGLENKNATDTLSRAAQVIKEANDLDKLEDTLGQLAELEQDQQQVDNLFAQQAKIGQDEDGLEDELAALEAEVNAEKANELNTKLNNIPVANVQQQQVYQQQQYQQQQQPVQQQQQKQDQAFSDALLDQLAL